MKLTSDITSCSRIGVDRRIGDLREQLLEIVVERFGLVREHRQRSVVAHRADRFFRLQRHRLHQQLDVFLRVAERLLSIEQGHVEPGLRTGASPAHRPADHQA
jgi:hypothetical protein